MSAIVVDASITGSILLWDEHTERTPEIQAVLRSSDIWVPAHWRIEVLNLLLTAERRQRITRQDRDQLSTVIETMGFSFDSSASALLLLSLADIHRLTTYDAAYLELAQRTGSRLATNDTALSAAAEASGITIISGRP